MVLWKKLLGYTYEKTLKDIFSEKRQDLSYINQINELEINTKIALIGQVEDTYSGVSKSEKKTKYLRLKISDETGNATVLIFNDKIDNCKTLNGGKNPEEGNIVIIKGIKKEDCIFADLVAIQDHEIYMKLSELKKIDI